MKRPQMALRRGRDGFVVEAAKPRGSDRPWSPAIADESEADATVLAPRVVPPRAVDATPAEADLRRRNRRNIASSSEVEAGSRRGSASKLKTSARRAEDLRGWPVF